MTLNSRQLGVLDPVVQVTYNLGVRLHDHCRIYGVSNLASGADVPLYTAYHQGREYRALQVELVVVSTTRCGRVVLEHRLTCTWRQITHRDSARAVAHLCVHGRCRHVTLGLLTLVKEPVSISGLVGVRLMNVGELVCFIA